MRGTKVTFSKEAREAFLSFATAKDAEWAGNFRDLNAAVTCMATLSAGGRVTLEIVNEEIDRLRRSWSNIVNDKCDPTLDTPLGAEAEKFDRFERVQLADVIAVCRQAKSLSDAGRQLFAVSRTKRGTPNDADRLRKYLARFGISFETIQS